MTDSLRRPEPGKPEPQAGVGGLAVVEPAKVEPDAQDALIFFVNPTGAAAALGVFYVVFAVFISLMLTSAFLKRAIVAVLAVAAPRFLISGVAEISGSQPVSKAAAVLGFLLAAVALYTAFALLMEDSRGREVLPIGRFGAARQATHGTLADELRDIERQPGVRRTL
jgi:hypothetical protein